MDILIQGSVEPIPASPTVKESASILAKGVITFLGLAFFLLVLNFSIFGFGKYVAPLVWISQIDRDCWFP